MAVMGRKGVDAATIADITEAADLGFGSFYNHFASKEEIAREVFRLRAAELVTELDNVFVRVQDPVLAAGFVQRWFVERGRRDPVWGWFVIHADAALDIVEATFKQVILADLKRITELGRFNIPSLDAAATITQVAIIENMRRQLEGNADARAESEMVEALLRMYGVPPDEAHAVAFAPLPGWMNLSSPNVGEDLPGPSKLPARANRR